ncbi:hypothetical protein D3C73_1512700 [compost metagenome]
MAHHYAVKPAYAAGASGDCTVLMTGLTNIVTDGIIQFRRERTIANTGSIRLGNTNNLLNLGRTYTGTDADTACGRIG